MEELMTPKQAELELPTETEISKEDRMRRAGIRPPSGAKPVRSWPRESLRHPIHAFLKKVWSHLFR